MHGTSRNIAIASVVVISIIVWSWVLIEFGPDTIIETLGIKNGYLLMGLVALFGGVSSFAGATYVATIITLAAAGFNPVGLAIASGIGISIGDTAYYYIGKYGLRELSSGRLTDRINKLTQWLGRKPEIVRFGFIYLYTAFTPLPNDLLTIFLGVAKQPLYLVLPALVAGNITLTYIIAIFSQTTLA